MTFMVNGNGRGYGLRSCLYAAMFKAEEEHVATRVTAFGGRTIVHVAPDGELTLTPFAVHYFRHANPTGEVCTVDGCETDHRGEPVNE